MLSRPVCSHLLGRPQEVSTPPGLTRGPRGDPRVTRAAPGMPDAHDGWSHQSGLRFGAGAGAGGWVTTHIQTLPCFLEAPGPRWGLILLWGVLLLAPLGRPGGGCDVGWDGLLVTGGREREVGKAQCDHVSRTQLRACPVVSSSALQGNRNPVTGPGDVAVTKTDRVLPSVLYTPVSLLQEGRRPINHPRTDRQTDTASWHCAPRGHRAAPASGGAGL